MQAEPRTEPQEPHACVCHPLHSGRSSRLRLSSSPARRQRLASGGPLRIVMLGDSICNETSKSLYETLLARIYPKAKIEIVTVAPLLPTAAFSGSVTVEGSATGGSSTFSTTTVTFLVTSAPANPLIKVRTCTR